MSRDLGDFQTPPELVSRVLTVLGPIGELWPRVLEPTCGSGNFINGLLGLPYPPLEIKGVELQGAHVRQAERGIRRAASVSVEIRHANLFDMDLRRDLKWTQSGPLLIIGNPPWVTAAEVSSLGGSNLPKKTNLRGLPGLDAITGESNFDLGEHIWIKLLTELAAERPTIAMLCKMAVARNVLRFAQQKSLWLDHVSIRRIDAGKWFHASVEACLLSVTVGSEARGVEAKVYPDLDSHDPIEVLSVVEGRVNDVSGYRRTAFMDGICSLTWRQGLKHDAATVMELRQSEGALRNKLGEKAIVEPDYLYPLLKGSDLFNQPDPIPDRFTIVTQRKPGEPTDRLRDEAPRLWAYLERNAAFFAKRKSAVFKGRFAIFGIGDYSFADHKVAVAGMYKTARFRVVRPFNGRPVMLDDTCYFVPCQSLEHAVLVASLLNDPICLEFIAAVTFADAKRPITKAVLQRIDLAALLARLDQNELRSRVYDEYARMTGREIPPQSVFGLNMNFSTI
ncbi:MAG: class I SAM-dependent methyltransferase [Desulfomonile tiedjei]|nr:class I SAM-dependent methyltransferase [Desulfomonile tiedjei]